MFDRDTAVSEWRRRMGESGLMGSELEELESHLLDQADSFVALGLTEEEALLLSARRLGDPSALRAEFECANPSRMRTGPGYWILVGCLLWATLFPVLTLATMVAVWGYAAVLPEAFRAPPPTTWGAILAHGAVAAVVFALVGYLAYRLCERRQTSRWQARFVQWSARPWRLIAVIIAIVLITTVLKVFGFQYAVRQMSGHFVALGNITSLCWMLVAPALLVLLLHRHRRRTPPPLDEPA